MIDADRDEAEEVPTSYQEAVGALELGSTGPGELRRMSPAASPVTLNDTNAVIQRLMTVVLCDLSDLATRFPMADCATPEDASKLMGLRRRHIEAFARLAGAQATVVRTKSSVETAKMPDVVQFLFEDLGQEPENADEMRALVERYRRETSGDVAS